MDGLGGSFAELAPDATIYFLSILAMAFVVMMTLGIEVSVEHVLGPLRSTVAVEKERQKNEAGGGKVTDQTLIGNDFSSV